MNTKKLIIEVEEKYVSEIVTKLTPIAKSIEVQDPGVVDFDFSSAIEIEERVETPQETVSRIGAEVYGALQPDIDAVEDTARSFFEVNPEELPSNNAPDSLSTAMSLAALRSHIGSSEFNDGIKDFAEFGNRGASGFHNIAVVTCLLMVLNRWTNNLELISFLGLNNATIRVLVDQLGDEGWILTKNMERKDGIGRVAVGMSKNIDHIALKPEIYTKMRRRWVNNRNALMAMKLMPTSKSPDISNMARKDPKATYKKQDFLVKNMRKELGIS